MTSSLTETQLNLVEPDERNVSEIDYVDCAPNEFYSCNIYYQCVDGKLKCLRTKLENVVDSTYFQLLLSAPKIDYSRHSRYLTPVLHFYLSGNDQVADSADALTSHQNATTLNYAFKTDHLKNVLVNIELNRRLHDQPELAVSVQDNHALTFLTDTSIITTYRFFRFEKPFIDTYLRFLILHIYQSGTSDPVVDTFARRDIIEQIVFHQCLTANEKRYFLQATAKYLLTNDFARFVDANKTVYQIGENGAELEPKQLPSPSSDEWTTFSYLAPSKLNETSTLMIPGGLTRVSPTQWVVSIPDVIELRNGVVENPEPGVLARVVFGAMDEINNHSSLTWRSHIFLYQKDMFDLKYCSPSEVGNQRFLKADIIYTLYDGVSEPTRYVIPDHVIPGYVVNLPVHRGVTSVFYKNVPDKKMRQLASDKRLFICLTIDILKEYALSAVGEKYVESNDCEHQ